MKNQWKKLSALSLSALLAVGMLAGCSTPAEETAPSESTSTSTAEETPATDSGEMAEITWYVGGPGPQADVNTVLDAANEYLAEQLNVKLDIIQTDFGSYTDKMQVTIAAQEEFDICWTANWSNSFYNNVNRGAFLELNDLLPEYAPELVELLPEAGFEATTVGGNIYGVPNYQIWAMTNGISLANSYIEETGFDVSTVSTLEDLEPFFAAVKEAHPDMYPLPLRNNGALQYLTFAMGYDELAGRYMPAVVMLDDEELNVVNPFELPQVIEHFELMYDWGQKGYFRPDASTITDYTADLAAGKHAANWEGTVKPGVEAAQALIMGTPVTTLKLSETWQPTSGIISTVNSVSRTSETPEKAVEFLNLVNTDAYLYNLITQGVEGVHYEITEDPYIAQIPDSGYAPNADWMYGNQFLAYLKEGQDLDVWEQTIEVNESAKPSVALGFVFDPEPVQNEIASINTVIEEYMSTLTTGVVDPNTIYDEFLAKLEAAGSQTLIDEVQTQLDAWAATL